MSWKDIVKGVEPTILEIEKTIEELKEKLKTTYNWKKRN